MKRCRIARRCTVTLRTTRIVVQFLSWFRCRQRAQQHSRLDNANLANLNDKDPRSRPSSATRKRLSLRGNKPTMSRKLRIFKKQPLTDSRLHSRSRVGHTRIDRIMEYQYPRVFGVQKNSLVWSSPVAANQCPTVAALFSRAPCRERLHFIFGLFSSDDA